MPVSVRICFVGDSFVNGTGDPDGLGWVGRVCAAQRSAGHDVTVYNLGIRGDTSAHIAARWEAEVSARLPAAFDGRVVFSFGVNDCCLDDVTDNPRVPLDASRAATDAVLSAAAGRWPVLMVGPPPIVDDGVNGRTAALNAAMADIAARRGIPYCDVFDRLARSGTWVREVAATDGAHPGAAGYAELADLIGGWDGWCGWFA